MDIRNLIHMKPSKKQKIFILLLILPILGSLLINSLCLFLNFNINENANVSLNENLSKLKQSAPDYWPDSRWRNSSPESQSMSTQKLLEMDIYITNQSIENFIDSLLIIRNGYLVYESYPSGIYNESTLHPLFSSTKGFTSALIGIAIEDGYIGGVNDYILDYFPNWTFNNIDSGKDLITIKHLLTMTAGLRTINYQQILSASDAVQFIMNQPMEHQPGEFWDYSGGASHLLTIILDQVTPNGTLAYAETSIFEPLNISNYLWDTDQQGVPMGGALLSLTPRDLAKFGFLYLNNGYWDGVQLIPSQWISESTKSYYDIGSDPKLGQVGYGYKWHIFKGINGYAIQGSNTQLIVVIPGVNLVVITTGGGSFLYQFVNMLLDYIIPSIALSPPDLIFVVPLIIGLVGIGVISGFIVYCIRKKRTTSKLKEG